MARNFARALSLLAMVLATSGIVLGAQPVVRQRWSLAIDSRNTGQWLSVRGSVVYTVRDAHVIAIELATGRVRWTSGVRVQSRPAIGGRTIYAPIINGIVALAAASGRELGRFPVTTSAELVTADFAAVAIMKNANGSRTRFLGFRDTLEPRWQREIAGGWERPEDVGHDTLLVWDDRADANVLCVPPPMHSTSPSEGMACSNMPQAGVVALDARGGNALAATKGVEDYVGRDNRTLWFSVGGGGLKSLDLDTNGTTAIHNAIVRGAVRVEGRTAVAVVDGRLTKISLPDGHQERLPIDGRWVGGPADQTIFVSRADGTYAQRLRGGRPVRVVTNTSDARFVTSTGKTAYFATNDGSVMVADLDTLAPATRLATACRFVEGVRVVDRTALIHCDDDRSASRLYAFGSPHPRTQP